MRLQDSLACLLFVALTSVTLAADVTKSTQTVEALQQTNAVLLKQFQDLKEAGETEQAMEVLREIVDIHRRSLLRAGVENLGEETITKLRDNYISDSNYLADQLFDRKDFAAAAMVRRDIEDYHRKNLGKDHNESIYAGWRRIEAERLQHVSEDIQDRYLASSDSVVQAKEMAEQERLAESVELYQSAIKVRIAALNGVHPYIASDLSGVAGVYWRMGQLEDAEMAYKESLRIRQGTTGRDLAYAATAFNLGRIYQQTQRFAEAEEMYLVSSEIEQAILGERHESHLQTLGQLASLYELTGEADKLAQTRTRLTNPDPVAGLLKHLPRDAYAMAVAKPASLIESQPLQIVPFEILQVLGERVLSFNPFEMTACIAFATTPIEAAAPHAGLLFSVQGNEQPQMQFLEAMEEVPGHNYYRMSGASGDDPSAMCFVTFDNGVSLLGTQEAVRQAIRSPGGSRLDKQYAPLAGHVYACADLQMLRPIIAAAMEDIPPLPEALNGLKATLNEIETVQLAVGVSNDVRISIALNAADEVRASRIGSLLGSVMSFGLQQAQQTLDVQFQGDDPINMAARSYNDRILRQVEESLAPQVNGRSVRLEINVAADLSGAAAIAILAPMLDGMRSASGATAANELKQIGLAMHMYHDVHGTFPARASYDADGNPLLSWRVHLLPYLEHAELYEQFHLEEPWDSPHNLRLVEQIPPIYQQEIYRQGRSRKGDPEEARYSTRIVTLDGVGTAMQGTSGITFQQFTDGTSNTILAAQCDPERAVIWTKPEDLSFSAENPGAGLWGQEDEEPLKAIFADGSVSMIPESVSGETLRRLIIRNDGEPVDRSEF